MVVPHCTYRGVLTKHNSQALQQDPTYSLSSLLADWKPDNIMFDDGYSQPIQVTKHTNSFQSQ